MIIRRLGAVGALAATVLAAPMAEAAVVVSKNLAASSSVPGLTGFTTLGSQMDGLSVIATFANGFTQSLKWADTGATSGGVSGTGWGLTESGDTYGAPWVFTFPGFSTLGALTQLVLDASGDGQITIFDTTTPDPGTPNSSQGRDFSISSGCASCNGTAVYSNPVGIGSAAAFGDLFHTLTITFAAGAGPTGGFQFLQDTDNDSRAVTGFVPEPSSITLVGAALVALGIGRRRHRAGAAGR